MIGGSQSASAQFLQFPLRCSDPNCYSIYSMYYSGAYTPGKIISVMDHSMVKNASGLYPFGSMGGTQDGIIQGFTGEIAGGGAQDLSNTTCIRKYTGTTFTLWNLIVPDAGGCYGNTNYIAYDEHPGYDYRAAYGTPVYAAYAGRVVNGSLGRCVATSGGQPCDSWGMIGIDHSYTLPPFMPQPYITQYEHMTNIQVYAGQYIVQGQLIGYTSNTAPRGITLPYHFHFEVLRLKPGAMNNYVVTNYLFIDPYGWAGGYYQDRLYSAAFLGFGITSQRLWR